MVTTRSTQSTSWTRGVNLLLGIWLFISAFAWTHTAASQTNTWIVGALIAIVSAISLAWPMARFIDTVLAVYLFVSTLLMPHAMNATPWHNAILAIVVFVLSLVPETSARRTTTGGPAHLPA